MSEREKAKQYALRLLSMRSYASHQLRAKMLEKGYGQEIVSEWIEWLLQMNLLQDRHLLSSLIERELSRGYGPKAILWKFKMKKFDEKELLLLLREIATDERQKEAIRAWVKKKKREKRASVQELIRRGFDVDLVFQTLRESP